MNQDVKSSIGHELASIQRIRVGVEAMRNGNILPVSQMFNPLSHVASKTNPRSPAFAGPAALDFADIIARLSMNSPLLAEQVFTAVGDMLQKVQDIPNLGGVGRYPDTREFQHHNHPIMLVYMADEDAVLTVVATFYMEQGLN